MSTRNDGGHAFPLSTIDGYAEDGMSLRDYVAVSSLASIGTWIPQHGGDNLAAKQAMEARAVWALEQADAFIRARHKDDGDAE